MTPPIRLRARPHPVAIVATVVACGLLDLIAPGPHSLPLWAGLIVVFRLFHGDAHLTLGPMPTLQVRGRALPVTRISVHRRATCWPGVAVRVEGFAFRVARADVCLIEHLDVIVDEVEPANIGARWRDLHDRSERLNALRLVTLIGGRAHGEVRAVVGLAGRRFLAALILVPVLVLGLVGQVVRGSYSVADAVLVLIAFGWTLSPERLAGSSRSYGTIVWSDDAGVWMLRKGVVEHVDALEVRGSSWSPSRVRVTSPSGVVIAGAYGQADQVQRTLGAV